MAATRHPWRWLPRVGVVLGVVGGLALAVSWTERLPEGPAPVAWDREACAHCRMHVGEPAFAAQLQLQDGRVLHFDDPGCLLRYEAEEHPRVHAAWFHHVREDRWIPGGGVAFVPVGPTPMGYGVGAVEAGVPGARAPADVLAGLRRERDAREGTP